MNQAIAGEMTVAATADTVALAAADAILCVGEESTGATESAEQAVIRLERQLRQVSTELYRAQDLERRRLARELHDGAAQMMTAIALMMAHLRETDPDAARRERLADALSLAEQCTREIRYISYGLHPPLLDELGLEGAIRAFAAGFQQRTGIQVEVDVPTALGRMGEDREMAVFRVVQEALSNVHRHSGSPVAIIALERKPHLLHVAIRDRGRGRPAGSMPKGLYGIGMKSMRERAEHFGGEMKVASNGNGTTVAVTLPLSTSYEENPRINRR